MKRILITLMLCIFLAGCGAAAKNSGFYEHDSIYKDWSHLWFSWHGYKNCPPDDTLKKLQVEGWWGMKYCPIP